MKLKLIRFTTLAFMALQFGAPKASADLGQEDLPRLYPECLSQNVLVMPKGGQGTSYFWNRDCTVAYLVPPPKAIMEVNNPAPSTNLRLCAGVASSANTVVQLYKQIEDLSKAAMKLKPTDPRLESYQTQIAKLNELGTKLQSSFSGLHGLTVQMSFRTGLTPDYVNEVILANYPQIEKGLKIRTAPLSKSYLSFNAIIPGTTKSFDGNPVLYSNIMGVLSKADEDQSAREAVIFNGSAEGSIALSLQAACPIISGDITKGEAITIDQSRARNYLVATNTMNVPLLTSFGYEASFDVDNATTVLFEKFGAKGQFTAREISDTFINGDISKMFQFKSWQYEDVTGEQKTVAADMISTEKRNAIKESFLAQYMNELIASNFIKEITPLETPNAGNETRTGTRRECWSKSFLGVTYDSGCENVTYQFLVPVDGTSSQTVTVKNNVKARLQERVEILQPVSRTFTSSFEIK